jgi:SAM-dependent methyltransferase
MDGIQTDAARSVSIAYVYPPFLSSFMFETAISSDSAALDLLSVPEVSDAVYGEAAGPVEEDEEDGDEGPDYGKADYWDDRYLHNREPFDWYQTWEHLHPLLGPFFDGTELVLNIGCGNSPMAVDMGSNFLAVANIDISSVVIEQMESAYQDHQNLLWFTMDCTDLDFEDEMFDVAFDKGTIDALFCGFDAIQKVRKTLAEVHRVLKPDGLFFEITYGKPENRMPTFEGFGLDWMIHDPVPIRNAERGAWHWIYIFEKRTEEEEGSTG